MTLLTRKKMILTMTIWKLVTISLCFVSTIILLKPFEKIFLFEVVYTDVITNYFHNFKYNIFFLFLSRSNPPFIGIPCQQSRWRVRLPSFRHSSFLPPEVDGRPEDQRQLHHERRLDGLHGGSRKSCRIGGRICKDELYSAVRFQLGRITLNRLEFILFVFKVNSSFVDDVNTFVRLQQYTIVS